MYHNTCLTLGSTVSFAGAFGFSMGKPNPGIEFAKPCASGNPRFDSLPF